MGTRRSGGGDGEPGAAWSRDVVVEHAGEPPPELPADPRVLAVRLDNAGDVVMLSPALRALRRAFPAGHLALLASPAGAAVGPLLPWVDEVIERSAVWQQAHGPPLRSGAQEQAEVVGALAAGRFDAAVVFTSFSQSPHPPAYACHLAGIPTRVGASEEFGGQVLTHWVRGTPVEAHQVDRNLALLGALGVAPAGHQLELVVPPGAREAAARHLVSVGVGGELPLALLAPGASASARRWPPERFGAVAAALGERGLAPVVVGGRRDRDRAAAVVGCSGGRARSLAGATTMAEVAALVERSAVVITNNSAPMHLADALGRPVVVLFAGTELERQWQPRRTAARLLRRPTVCAPCHLMACPFGGECLDLPPAEVVAAVEEVLREGPSTPPAWAAAPGGSGAGTAPSHRAGAGGEGAPR